MCIIVNVRQTSGREEPKMTTTNETKRVSDREYDEAYEEMLANFKELTNGEYDGRRRIEFYFDEDPNAEGYDKPWHRPKVMQVNWAAIGTVTADETASFARALMYAAELAAGFKYNGCKVYYED